MEFKELGFFKKRLMKRRVTLASITSFMHDKIGPAIKEEESDTNDSIEEGINIIDTCICSGTP